MPAPALLLALALMASEPAAAAPDGEPLPAGAPSGDYALSAWCYGALSEYLTIYDRVKPDLIDIDKKFGSSVQNEAEPYADDVAALREELKVIGGSVEAAEKASPRPITPEGVAALELGRSIWRPVEEKSRRELARAWLSWGLPDRCDSNARTLSAKSALLGQALKYNETSATEAPPTTQSPAPTLTPADPAPTPSGGETPHPPT